ncbi:hypothetical protein Salat_2546900 [Sesamum alatum]|uniref:GRF-type domain-containing protein n=1 Tax=Sesamum alatum TaxID=300844 RepID=A0AAE2CCK5_9LAMI|nr:hypothetical protein Salat_2546900 [Sesamum alatum]
MSERSYGSSNVSCKCGKQARLKCSWTNENPGRRFYSCEDYKKIRHGRHGCDFFLWEDPPVCPRAMVVVPGLLRNIREKEKRISSLNENIKEKDIQIASLKMKLSVVVVVSLSIALFLLR